jgi:hypothetical protein
MKGRNGVKFVVCYADVLIDAYIIHFDDVFLPDWSGVQGQIADLALPDYIIMRVWYTGFKSGFCDSNTESLGPTQKKTCLVHDF